MRRLLIAALLAAVAHAGALDAGAVWSVRTVNPLNSMNAGTLAAPTGVTAKPGKKAVTLSWAAPPVAQQGTGTLIDRNVNGGAYATLATVTSGAATTYTDDNGGAGLHPGWTYCYRLTTVDAAWAAGPTAAVCATP